MSSKKAARALESLFDGQSVRQAALSAGCSIRQVYRWMQAPEFTACIREHDSATGARLATLESQALDALIDVLSNPGQKAANIKRLAAKDILDIRLRWMLSDELERRMSEIERRLDESQNKHRS